MLKASKLKHELSLPHNLCLVYYFNKLNKQKHIKAINPNPTIPDISLTALSMLVLYSKYEFKPHSPQIKNQAKLPRTTKRSMVSIENILYLYRVFLVILRIKSLNIYYGPVIEKLLTLVKLPNDKLNPSIGEGPVI